MLKNIGKWKVIPLETGDFRLDGGAMMGSVPKILWEKTNPSDKFNRIDLSLRCLLLDDGVNKVLIETGMGNKLDDKFKNRFHVKQDDNPLQKCLSDVNIKIKDITHVILTHLHFDHSGGATIENSIEGVIPAFPNAKYYISKKNWDIGNNPNPRDRASYLNINYNILEDSNQLVLLDDNVQILDGINTIMVNGHTEGQQLIKIVSENDCLVFCSDLIPLKSHIQLPWIMGYDLNAKLTLEEKTKFLKEAAEKGWWLWLYHDPKVVALKIIIDKKYKYYNVIKEIKRDDRK